MKRTIGCSMGLTVALAGAGASAQGKPDNIGNAGGIVIGAEHLAGVYVSKINAQTEQTRTVG